MTEEKYIECVNKNSQRLYLIALSFTKNQTDAEDILQNTYLKLWRYNKPFKDDEHMEKWLSKVCVNECKNYVISPFRRKITSLEECKEVYTLDNEKDYDLLFAVMSLPKSERTVIHLFYYEDMSIKEIAALLSVKENAVKTRLHRARKKLRDRLGDEWMYE